MWKIAGATVMVVLVPMMAAADEDVSARRSRVGDWGYAEYHRAPAPDGASRNSCVIEVGSDRDEWHLRFVAIPQEGIRALVIRPAGRAMLGTGDDIAITSNAGSVRVIVSDDAQFIWLDGKKFYFGKSGSYFIRAASTRSLYGVLQADMVNLTFPTGRTFGLRTKGAAAALDVLDKCR